MRICHRCRKELDLQGPAGRREACPSCGADLHVCRNCRHYDPACYNQCRETQAERVVEKERSNFCDFFAFREVSVQSSSPEPGPSGRDKLESLFRK